MCPLDVVGGGIPSCRCVGVGWYVGASADAVGLFKEIMVTYPNKSLKTSMVKLMVSAGKITISSLKMGAGKN